MSPRNFTELLSAGMEKGRTVCVGLDTDIRKLDGKSQYDFNVEVIDATAGVALAYKLNLAFYMSNHGIDALVGTSDHIRSHCPEAVIILDAKQGDIDNTNLGYIEFDFDHVAADAVTVHWYMGLEKGMRPFIDQTDKGVFVLCRTSNAGAAEDQSRLTEVTEAEQEAWGVDDDYLPMYQVIAHRVAHDWNVNGNCGVVVGATAPDELVEVRDIVGDMPILIPGLGAQEGDAEATVKAGVNSKGHGMVINSSRGIIFAESPFNAARDLHDQVRHILANA